MAAQSKDWAQFPAPISDITYSQTLAPGDLLSFCGHLHTHTQFTKCFKAKYTNIKLTILAILIFLCILWQFHTCIQCILVVSTLPLDFHVFLFYSPLSPISAVWASATYPWPQPPSPKTKVSSSLSSHWLPIILMIFKHTSSVALTTLISWEPPSPSTPRICSILRN